MTALPLLDICLESNCAWARLLTHVCTRTHTRSDWLIDWLTGWLAGWLTDWLTPSLIDWLAGWLTGWYILYILYIIPTTRARVRGAWMAGGLVGNWVAGWCQHGPRMMILAKTRQNSTMMYVIVELFSPFGDVMRKNPLCSTAYWNFSHHSVSGEKKSSTTQWKFSKHSFSAEKSSTVLYDAVEVF